MNEFDKIRIANMARQMRFNNAALTEEEKQFNVLKKAVDAGNLPSEVLIKARSGIYKDNPVNRKKGRVGTRYGKKAEGGDTYDLENGGKMGKKPEKRKKSNVWTEAQVSAVNANDKAFGQHLKKKGIDPYSYEASQEWKKAGFQDKQKEIFGKKEVGDTYDLENGGKMGRKPEKKEDKVKYGTTQKQDDVDIIRKEVKKKFGSLDKAKKAAKEKYDKLEKKTKAWNNLSSREKVRTMPPPIQDAFVSINNDDVLYLARGSGKGTLLAPEGAGLYARVKTNYGTTDYKIS